MSRFVLRMPDAETPASGPKAAVLARAARVGLPVPEFVVVTANAYREHAARAGVVAAGQPDAVHAHEAITALPLDTALAEELREALAGLGEGPFAVRSSGTAEDLPGLSFAGQHGTYFAADADAALARVVDCWGSLWSERAFDYRARQGIAHDDVAMAVIVQQLVRASAAGVAFTADPLSGEELVTIEGCDGIGELLVSGKLTPDRWVFSDSGFGIELRSSEVGYKPVALMVGDDGAVRSVERSEEDARRPCVTDEVAREVAVLALAAEALLDCAADVEWAHDGGRVWLLQARPITGAAARADGDATVGGPRYRATAWTNVNTGEVLPDVLTPMTWSVVGRLASGLVEALLGKLGVRVDISRLTTLIGGRAYFNASLLASAFERLPMAGTDLTSIFGGEDAPPGYGDLPVSPADSAHVSTLRVIAGLPLVAIWALQHSPARAVAALARMNAQTDETLAAIDAATGEDEVARVTAQTIDGLDDLVDALAFSGVAMSSFAGLIDLSKRYFGDDGPRLANQLLSGQGGVDSAESGIALARMSRFAREHEDVRIVLQSGEEFGRIRARLDALPEGREFLAIWQRFMAEHGHHARGELEFGCPRWAERPDEVLAMVTTLLDVSDKTDLLAARERRAAEIAEAEKRELGSLGPWRRFRFARALHAARAGARTRENLKSGGVRALAAGRVALLKLGAAMTERGVLDAADDILYLRWEEVPEVRAGALEAHDLVAQRRAEYEHNRSVTPPSVVIGEWDGVAADTDGAEPLDALSGLAVSGGISHGPARVIRTLLDGDRVLPGEVLVAPFTDPGWTPYFVPAAGIVVDMGGMLSHGSIIAREYGIPAVVNVGPATTSIRTGDLVEVDGDAGVVRVLERGGSD